MCQSFNVFFLIISSKCLLLLFQSMCDFLFVLIQLVLLETKRVLIRTNGSQNITNEAIKVTKYSLIKIQSFLFYLNF